MKSALVSLGMVGAGVSALMWAITVGGLAPWSPDEVEEEPEPQAEQQDAVTLASGTSPAHQFVQNTLSSWSDGFDGRARVDSAQPPFPMSCPSYDALLPVSSGSVSLDLGFPVQAYVAAYPAGQGAPQFASQIGSQMRECSSGSAASWAADGPGAESRWVHSEWNGSPATTLSWRVGDVIMYAVADRGHAGRLPEAAGRLHDIASESGLSRCVDPDSTVEDADRSPFHAPGPYRGYLVPHTISISEPDTPDAPEGIDDPRLPMHDVDVVEVVRPPVPEYPVWPDLPPELDVPEAPEPPAAPVTEKEIRVLRDDVSGPGCGWEFSGEVKPRFDHDEAKRLQDQDTRDAELELSEAADEWKSQVEEYWESWVSYMDEVERYREYAQEVSEVTEAWEPIHDQWEQYRRLLGEYRDAMDAREAEERHRARVEERYEDRLTRCEPPEDAFEERETEAPVPDPEPTGTEGTTEEPSLAPEPEPEPEPEWTPPPFCPVERPSILDEPLPEVPEEPQEPADPRP